MNETSETVSPIIINDNDYERYGYILKKSELRIHFGLFLAELICVPAFVFELFRARHGNTLSWAYVVEWPVLGSYAVYMWAKLLREEKGVDKRSRDRVAEVAATRQQEEDDPDMRAWNDYLASVHGTQAPEDEKRSD